MQTQPNEKIYNKKSIRAIVIILTILGSIFGLDQTDTININFNFFFNSSNSASNTLTDNDDGGVNREEENEQNRESELKGSEPEPTLEPEPAPESSEVKSSNHILEKAQLPDLFWEDNSFRIVGFHDLLVPSSSPIEIRQTVEYTKGDNEISQFCVKVEIQGPVAGKIPVKFKDPKGLIVPPHMKDKERSYNSDVPDEKCFDNVESLNRLEYEVTLVVKGWYTVTHIIDYENKVVDEIKETNNAFVKQIKVN